MAADDQGNQGAIIDERRRRVAAMALRGLSQREIVASLPTGREPLFNPKTGKAFNLATVNRDLQALRKQWREAAAVDLAAYKARILAELQEVKRQAWSQKDTRAIIAALKQECDILGIDAPKGLDITSGGKALKAYIGLSPDDWDDGSETDT
jgi:hypothetical protein